MQNYAQGAGRNVTYPIGMNAGSVGSAWGLDRSSYVIVDMDGIIQYISPQSTDYKQRLRQHETEMKAKLDELILQTGISSSGDELPYAYKLYQNSPNPFISATNLRFELGSDANQNITSLIIYDILGREVKSLTRGYLSKGAHSYTWNARDNSGKSVSAGTYFIIMKSHKQQFIKKMTLLP